MNRRGFLASLPFLPAIAKAVLTAPPDDVYRCVITPNVKTYNLKSIAWTTQFSSRKLWFVDWSDISVGYPPTPLERARKKLATQLASAPLPLP